MSIESEKSLESAREKERNYESKESKEAETDKELQAAAALERADFLVGEVKSSKKQMQNIVVHMQQVLAALKALRDQLQISASADDNSIVQDKKRVEDLKKKILEYKDELLKMKDELIAAQMEDLQKAHTTLSDVELRDRAEGLVGELLKQIGE